MATLHLSVSSTQFGGSARTVHKPLALRSRDWRRSGVCRCAAPPLSTTANLYSMLGVSFDGSSADIKRAYKELARRYHPDVNPPETHDACTQKFVAVQQAYEILSNPSRKAEYDYALKNLLLAHTYANSSWGRGSQEVDGSTWSPWRLQWELQLSRYHGRDGAKWRSANASSTSWGARMRQKNSEPFP